MSTLAELTAHAGAVLEPDAARAAHAVQAQRARLGVVDAQPAGDDARLLVRLRHAAGVDGAGRQPERACRPTACSSSAPSCRGTTCRSASARRWARCSATAGWSRRWPSRGSTSCSPASPRRWSRCFIELGVLSVVHGLLRARRRAAAPGRHRSLRRCSSLFVVGLSLMLSAANVFFRDLSHLWGIVAPGLVLPDPGRVPAGDRRGQAAGLGCCGSTTTCRWRSPSSCSGHLLYDGRYPTLANSSATSRSGASSCCGSGGRCSSASRRASPKSSEPRPTHPASGRETVAKTEPVSRPDRRWRRIGQSVRRAGAALAWKGSER